MKRLLLVACLLAACSKKPAIDAASERHWQPVFAPEVKEFMEATPEPEPYVAKPDPIYGGQDQWEAYAFYLERQLMACNKAHRINTNAKFRAANREKKR
jgi:hypothetical protein